MQDSTAGITSAGMETVERQPSLTEVLDNIRALPRLQPQERRVVLREVIACCDEGDIQVLQRLLGQTTQSGFDLVSSLPVEISHHIFLYLEGMDLVRCRAVCQPWRSMIQGDTGLWKAKIQEWNAAECALLKDRQELQSHRGEGIADAKLGDARQHGFDSQMRTIGAEAAGTDGATTIEAVQAISEKEISLLDRISRGPDFIGWEAALVQELALRQNWKRGRYVYEMTVTLPRNIKPALLAWPFLILVDDWPILYRISLDRARRDRYRVIPVGEERYARTMEMQGHGAVSCMAWDQSSISTERVSEAGSEVLVESSLSEPLPLAVGGFLRSVRVCDPATKASVALPDVHHGFPLHLCFLRKQVLSVTLDGQITFFHKGEDYRPIRSCTVSTKVLQITPIDFSPQAFEREQSGELVSWSEVICLGHEDGVVIKDEHSHTLCHVRLDVGSKLLLFQAIADGIHVSTSLNTHAGSNRNDINNRATPYRNELLILFEDPNTRQRRVLRVKMEPGFRAELARENVTPSFSLGRGGDARDSIVMHRDRIAIVSHRNCSSDLGHYCVLRLMDLREEAAVTTEYTQQVEEESEEILESEEEGVGTDGALGERYSTDGDHQTHPEAPLVATAARIQRRAKLIHLNDFAGHKAACRILAMDHARIVLGMGPRIVKVLCLV